MKLFDVGDIAILLYNDMNGLKREAVMVLDTDVAINSSHGDMEWSYFIMDNSGKKFWVDEYDLKPVVVKVGISNE